MSTSDSLGKILYLSESFGITSSIPIQSLTSNSHTIQPITTLDRINQIDKINDRKKNSKLDLLLASEFIDNSKTDINLLSSDHLSVPTASLLILENIKQYSFYDDFSFFSENLLIDYNFENVLQSIDIFDLSLDTVVLSC